MFNGSSCINNVPEILIYVIFKNISKNLLYQKGLNPFNRGPLDIIYSLN